MPDTLCHQGVIPCPYPYVAGGWTLYGHLESPDGTSTNAKGDAWLRSPSGEKSKISLFTASTSLENLNEHGDALLGSSGRRYLVTNGGPTTDVSPMLGKSSWRAAHWFFAVGRTVFVLDGDAADGGVAPALDAGAPDARESGAQDAPGNPIITDDAPSDVSGHPRDAAMDALGTVEAGELSSDAELREDVSATDAVPVHDASTVTREAAAACDASACTPGVEAGYAVADAAARAASDDSGCNISSRRSQSTSWAALGYVLALTATRWRRDRRRRPEQP